MPRFNSKASAAGLKHGWRSGLEEAVGDQLKAAGVKAKFEDIKIPFTQPEKPRHYTPDWVLPNGIIIETKGRFVTADRQKHLLVQAQHPALEIRFVFSNSNTRISKKSKTTYAAWAKTKGFMYADKLVPPAWLKEPIHSASLAAIAKLRNL